jgi:hypothetical protein
MPEYKKTRADKPYTHSQIEKLLEISDERMRCVILILASSGIRSGAIPLISRAKRLSVSLQLQVKVMIDLENNDILEICATVIAGALIFLTLSSSSISKRGTSLTLF